MPGRVFTEPERTRMGAFPSEIAEPDMIRPCSAIDSKKFIYLRHDPDRALIFGIDFDRLEELSPALLADDRRRGRVEVR